MLGERGGQATGQHGQSTSLENHYTKGPNVNGTMYRKLYGSATPTPEGHIQKSCLENYPCNRLLSKKKKKKNKKWTDCCVVTTNMFIYDIRIYKDIQYPISKCLVCLHVQTQRKFLHQKNFLRIFNTPYRNVWPVKIS